MTGTSERMPNISLQVYLYLIYAYTLRNVYICVYASHFCMRGCWGVVVVRAAMWSNGVPKLYSNGKREMGG